MRSKNPIPRSPRNQAVKDTVTPRSRIWVWVGRVSWVVLGGIATSVISVLTQGPEAIKHAPEIPNALYETVQKRWESWRVDSRLSGSWEYAPSANSTPADSIRLLLDVKGGKVVGELVSSAVHQWTPYSTAMVEGRLDGPFMKLTVFDYIFGERTRFAELEVRVNEEGNDSITDHQPELVAEQLEARVVWQRKKALPDAFSLRQVK